MSDPFGGRDLKRIAVSSLPDSFESAPALADLSPRDKPWDKHRANADKVATLYAGSEFQDYSDRVTFCSEFLKFGLVPDDQKEVLKLKLRASRFCRVRHCPVCQWRRSLMWKAKAFQVLPQIVKDFPKHRWLFVTLTQRNVPIAELRLTLQNMNKAFQRLAQRKVWPATGWLRSTEVTRGKNGTAHPHFHCLLLVPASYFSNKYIRKSEWIELWQSALRIDYKPILDVQSIREGQQPMQLVPELLKYCVKESDLIGDRQWFLELTRQMHKMRCVSTGGILKHYLKELEQEPDDLIGEGEDELLSQDDELSLYFNWKRVEKKYRMSGYE